jgi:His/Glu/Gln/Arg/opine family amino acid ABC transporter permease subunit
MLRAILRARAQQWGEYFGHLPWYRRYEFLALGLIVLAGAGVFLVPSPGRPHDPLTWCRILLSYLMFFGWVLLILTDREKPVWLKRLASLSVVILFFLFFYWFSGADWSGMSEKFFNVKALDGVWPMYLDGTIISIKLTLVAAVLSVGLGAFLGVLRTFKNPVLSVFTIAYVDLFRSFPIITLMMVVFYALPFIGLRFSAFASASLSIVLVYSAYISEMVRSGVESVHPSQFDAARSLGLTQVQALVYVVVPQAVRIIIPPLTTSLVGILKDTVVAYAVTLPELLTQAKQASSWKLSPTPVVVSSLIYLIILFPLTRFANRMEKRSKRWTKTPS